MSVLKNGVIFCIAFMLSFSAIAESATSAKAGAITHKEIAKEVWIDVRTSSEYSKGHVEGAYHIPYDEIEDGIAALGLDKDANIHLYCRSGGRAGKALKVLKGMGYSQVHNDGGLSNLAHPAKLAE